MPQLYIVFFNCCLIPNIKQLIDLKNMATGGVFPQLLPRLNEGSPVHNFYTSFTQPITPDEDKKYMCDVETRQRQIFGQMKELMNNDMPDVSLTR